MTNRIGWSETGRGDRTHLVLDCQEGLGVIVDLPRYLWGIPGGMVIYIDNCGCVRAMDDPDGV